MKVLVVRHTWCMGGLFDASYEIDEGESVEAVAMKWHKEHGELDKPDRTSTGEYGFTNGNEEVFLFMPFNG